MGTLGISGKQRRMVIVLLAGAVLVVLNQTLLSPALPSIMQHMGVDATTVQWLTSAYALTEAVVIPLAAWFMGHFSTRKLFLGGMTLFGAGSLVAALAPVFGVLLVGRIMQAMATGVLMVMVTSLILLSFPRESRGQAMGLVGLVIAFAPAVGPSVGGFLVDIVGWRALFCVVVVLAIIVIAFAALTLVNYDGFPRTSADALSIVLSTLGLASLLYGLSSFASSSHAGLCAAFVVIGAVLVGLFVRRQFALDEPMLKLEVLRSRRYRTAFLTMGALQAILVGLGVLLPLYIQDVLGYSAGISGLATLPGAVLGAIAGLVAGRVFDRTGVRKIAIAGIVILLASCVGMLFYSAYSALWFVVAFNVLGGIGVQLLTTPVNTWGVNSLSNELVQHATSVTNTMNQVGGSLGTALIMSFSALGTSMATQGTEVERMFSGYHVSFIVVMVLALIIAALVLFCVRDKKSDLGAESRPASSEHGRPHRAAEVMDLDPLVISASASMAQAAQALAEGDASGAVVLDEDDTVCGFISNSDILRFFGDQTQAIVGTGGFAAMRVMDAEDVRERVARLGGIPVTKMATSQVVSVAPHTSFEETCHLLAEKRLKEIPVVEEGKLVGVVRRRSLMRLVASMLHEREEGVQVQA